jgi:hypothetical protein
MSRLFVLAAQQSESSRILVGCFGIAAGVGIAAWNRTQWSLRLIERVSRIYVGRRFAPHITRGAHYACYVGAAFFIIIGLLAVTGLVT